MQENQDKFLLQMNRDDGWTVMGVFDGHGMWGGKVASAVRDSMVAAMRDVDGRKMDGSDPEKVQRSPCCTPFTAQLGSGVCCMLFIYIILYNYTFAQDCMARGMAEHSLQTLYNMFFSFCVL